MATFTGLAKNGLMWQRTDAWSWDQGCGKLQTWVCSGQQRSADANASSLCLIFQRALSKIGLTVDMEGVKAWVCGAQARCSQGASSLLAAHELEMSATFVSPNACVQPLNYMSNAATE